MLKMLEYKISVVVNSTDPEAKKYLFECWGDNRISPQVAYMAGLENKDYIHHCYFDTLDELNSILKVLKERLSVPKEKDETGGLYLKTEYSQEEIEKIISDIENIAKKTIEWFEKIKKERKKQIFISKEGRELLKSF